MRIVYHDKGRGRALLVLYIMMKDQGELPGPYTLNPTPYFACVYHDEGLGRAAGGCNLD